MWDNFSSNSRHIVIEKTDFPQFNSLRSLDLSKKMNKIIFFHHQILYLRHRNFSILQEYDYRQPSCTCPYYSLLHRLQSFFWYFLQIFFSYLNPYKIISSLPLALQWDYDAFKDSYHSIQYRIFQRSHGNSDALNHLSKETARQLLVRYIFSRAPVFQTSR